MAHCNMILSKILKLVSRHAFETLAKQYHSGHAFRIASRWSQFVSLTMAQLSGRNCLRDIVDNMSAQIHRLYHLCSINWSRSNLSCINEDNPYTLHAALFEKLFTRCKGVSPDHNFRFKNRCIRWMPQLSTCICQYLLVLIFALLQEWSHCMSDWIM